MATEYTAVVRVPEGNRSLADLLSRLLTEDGEEGGTSVGRDGADLLVSVDVAAADASVAQRHARERVAAALRRAGIERDEAIDLRDIAVRSSS